MDRFNKWLMAVEGLLSGFDQPVVASSEKIFVESTRKSAILSRMSLESLRPRVRARVATHVFLRLTAMDVCCGPPASR
jgi:hypothetical protein